MRGCVGDPTSTRMRPMRNHITIFLNGCKPYKKHFWKSLFNIRFQLLQANSASWWDIPHRQISWYFVDGNCLRWKPKHIPLVFAIVEGETKEAIIWFFIIDRGTTILSALQYLNVDWEGYGLSSIFCIRHIASNFNKKFKSVELRQ